MVLSFKINIFCTDSSYYFEVFCISCTAVAESLALLVLLVALGYGLTRAAISYRILPHFRSSLLWPTQCLRLQALQVRGAVLDARRFGYLAAFGFVLTHGRITDRSDLFDG